MRTLTAIRARIGRNDAIVWAYAVAALLFLIGTIKTLDFAAAGNVRTLLVTASFIGFVGLGQTLCMLTGGIDLSVPAVLAGSAVLAAKVSAGDGGKLVGVLLLLVALAAVVGLLNGVGVAYLGVPPIIMTLGMGGAIQGLVLVYTHGGFAASPPHALVTFTRSDVLGIPTLIVIWLVVAALGTLLLSGTTFGRRLYAVGTNARAAFLAGVAVRRVILMPYVVSAVGAALTGVLLLGYRGQAFNNMGDEYLFSSAVAVAVGGASILGGRGHYLGTIAGALILILVVALLPLFGLGSAAVQVSYGVILIAAVLLANTTRGGSRNA